MDSRDILVLKSDSEFNFIKNSEISIMDLASTGSNISKYPIDAAFKKIFLIQGEENEAEMNHSQNMSMEEFLDDFKL